MGTERFGIDSASLHLGGVNVERQDVWTSMANEMVKSYGFRNEGQGWSWSVENIGKSFQEDPFWTTLDYLTLVAAPAKAVGAAFQVERGIGAVGKAYRAGEFAGSAVKGMGLQGELLRGIERFTGKEGLGAAAELSMAGPSRGFKVGRFTTGQYLQSPGSIELSDQYLGMVDRWGAEPWEQRGIVKSLQNEKKIALSSTNRQAQDAIKLWQGVAADKGEAAYRALEQGVIPDNVLSLLGGDKNAAQAYRATWEYRNKIHDAAFESGLISEETYKENLGKYAPRLYKEFQEMNASRIAVGAPSAGGAAAKRFAKRGDELEEFTRVLDPRTALTELSKAGSAIARKNYVEKLATSVVARDGEDVAKLAREIVADPKLAVMHGISNEKMGRVSRMVAAADEVGRLKGGGDTGEIAAHDIARSLGWQPLHELFKNLPEVAKNAIGSTSMNKWIDPAAAGDIAEHLKHLNDTSFAMNMYNRVTGYFQSAKTVLNPATHVRNIFGAAITHNFATGTLEAPIDGLRSFRAPDRFYEAGRNLGIVGSSHSTSALDALHDAARGKAAMLAEKAGQKFDETAWAEGRAFRSATSLDWLGDSKVAQIAQKGAGHMGDFYRATDEVFKLDAFIKRTKAYEAAGKDAETAYLLGARDVRKFMPEFMSQSPIAEGLRAAIPFSSFTSEALRIWKNVLQEKPHMAFFWNHATEALSDAFGAMSGLSPEEVEQAKSNLPDYVQSRKTVMLPFKIGGESKFIDLSYIIPLGSMSDAEQSGNLFFSTLYDVSANPLLNMTIAATTGKDAFTGQDIAPNFTERQLGVPIEGARTRKIMGLAEHMAVTMLPPWAPPGYAGVNLLEAARGQVHPNTGEKLEDGVLSAIAGNLLAAKTYSPNIATRANNLRRENQEFSDMQKQAWDRWNSARANSDLSGMAAERDRILTAAIANGDSPKDAFKSFAQGAQRRRPFADLSTAQLRKLVDETPTHNISDKDKRMRAELMARLQSRGQ